MVHLRGLATLALQVSAAFPIVSLNVTSDEFIQLSGGSGDFATSLILPHLAEFFAKAENAIAVGPGDIVVQSQVPDTTLDTSCSHKIEALNGHVRGDVTSTSYLRGGTTVTWNSVRVFMDAELDATLSIDGDVRVRTGVKLFHHCDQVARDTMGLSLSSTGQNGVGISLTASNARVETTGAVPALVFDFNADVWGTVTSWNVDEVSVNHGCKLKVLGITIVSVCGYVESKVKDQAQKLLKQVTKIDAPVLLQRLEDKINTAIGSEVRIPLGITTSLEV